MSRLGTLCPENESYFML